MKFLSSVVPAFLRREGVQRALKAALALAAIGSLVYLVEPSEIVEAVAQAHYGYLVVTVLLLPLNLFLEGGSWWYIVKAAVPQVSWRTVGGALLCGHALGLSTPARAGEYAGRAFYFEEGDRWAVAATVFVQRLLDMLVAVAFGTAALAWALTTARLAGRAWQGALVIGLCVSLAVALLLAWPGRAGRYARRWLPAGARTHLGFLERLGPARMGGATLLGVARYLVYVTQFVLLARAFAPGAALPLLYGGVGLVFFAKFLLPSLTLMDVGIREGAAVFFLSVQLGLPQAASFNAAFLLFLINLALPAAVGAPLLMKLRLSKEAPLDENAAPPAPPPAAGSKADGGDARARERSASVS